MTPLLIDSTQTTTSLKQAFNNKFPFLRIEFFQLKSLHDKRYTRDKILKNEERIGAIQSKKASGTIPLDPTTTVRELEAKFREEFGLNIQVFRKSGRIWLETISTDHWTLAQQNEVARSLEEQLNAESERAPDEEIDWSAMN